MVWSRPVFFLLGLLVVLTLTLRIFIFELLWIQSDRFQPALNKGDLVVGLRSAVPKKGEYVSHLCIQRRSCISQVLGVEGDRVDIQRGRLWVNESPVTPALPLSPDAALPESGSWVVPPNSYFVYGDELGLMDRQNVHSVFANVLVRIH